MFVPLDVPVDAVVPTFLDSGCSQVWFWSDLQDVVAALNGSLQSLVDLSLIVFQCKKLGVRFSVTSNSNLPPVSFSCLHSADVLVLDISLHGLCKI